VTWPAVPRSQVPVIAAAAMRQADREAAERFQIQPIQLMETAGFQLARFVDAFLESSDQAVTIVAGGGNNGADALVAARHLHNRGIDVSIWFVGGPPQGLNAQHLQTANALRIPVVMVDSRNAPAPTGGVILDGLLGTGIRLPLRLKSAAVIDTMNRSGLPIIAVDIPSGLDAETGAGQDGCVRAAATVTLGLPKPALLSSIVTGRLFVADIGLPPALFGAAADAARQLFADETMVEVV
jgi:hydroxyethylthiazole kinase-like uncharacterized protein yjeF